MQTYLECTIIVLLSLLQCSSVYGNSTDVLKPRLVRIMSQENETFTNFDSGYVGKSENTPFVVALEFSRGGGATWFCVGSIISHRWIVTVASCTNPAEQVKVSYGAGNRLEPTNNIYISKRSFRTRFDFNKLYHNDIALIKVPYINYSAKVKSVSLPSSSIYIDDPWMISVGWGQHKDNGRLMHQMHVMQIQMMPNNHCINGFYGSRFLPQMLCAQLPNMETSCRIDSGSPLFTQRPLRLLGIASFGDTHGCRSSAPLVYTRISSYVRWIQNMMSE